MYCALQYDQVQAVELFAQQKEPNEHYDQEQSDQQLAHERGPMNIRSSPVKWQPLRSPVLKYSLIALAFGLWGFGLVEQSYSSASDMKYLLMAMIIGVLAIQ